MRPVPTILSAIRAGDRILIDDAIEGEVVFSTLSQSYALDHPETDWSGSEHDGIMIRQDNGALVFHSRDYLVSSPCRVRLSPNP